MNFAEVKRILCNAFEASWTSTKLAFGNEILDTEPFWTRMVVRELSSEQYTMGPVGARKFRRDCTVFVDVFSPVEGAWRDVTEGGEDAGSLLGEDVRRFFESTTLAPAKFRGCTVNNPARDEDAKGRWWVTRASAPFYFIEVA